MKSSIPHTQMLKLLKKHEYSHWVFSFLCNEFGYRFHRNSALKKVLAVHCTDMSELAIDERVNFLIIDKELK